MSSVGNVTVESNPNVATFIKELTLTLPEGEDVAFRAGGYVQLECPPHHIKYADFDIEAEYRGDWERFDFFKHESIVDETVIRAYSMANYPDEKGVVKFNIRIATPPPGSTGIVPGQMSSYVFSLKPGDKISVYGPFGEFFAKDTDKRWYLWVVVLVWRQCARISLISSSVLNPIVKSAFGTAPVHCANVSTTMNMTCWPQRTTTSTGIWHCQIHSQKITGMALPALSTMFSIEQYLKGSRSARGLRVLYVRATNDECCGG